MMYIIKKISLLAPPKLKRESGFAAGEFAVAAAILGVGIFVSASAAMKVKKQGNYLSAKHSFTEFESSFRAMTQTEWQPFFFTDFNVCENLGTSNDQGLPEHLQVNESINLASLSFTRANIPSRIPELKRGATYLSELHQNCATSIENRLAGNPTQASPFTEDELTACAEISLNQATQSKFLSSDYPIYAASRLMLREVGTNRELSCGEFLGIRDTNPAQVAVLHNYSLIFVSKDNESLQLHQGVDVITAPVTNAVAAAFTVDLKANGQDSNICVDSNDTVSLSWSSVNVDSCSLTGVNPARSERSHPGLNVGPMTAATTFTLSCTSQGQTGTDAISICINPPPSTMTADLKINNQDAALSVSPGTDVTLTWSSANAATCTVGPSGFTGTGSTGPGQTVTVNADTTFVLTCTDSGGATVTDSIAVTTATSGSVCAKPSSGPVNISFSIQQGATTITSDSGTTTVGSGTSLTASRTATIPTGDFDFTWSSTNVCCSVQTRADATASLTDVSTTDGGTETISGVGDGGAVVLTCIEHDSFQHRYTITRQITSPTAISVNLEGRGGAGSWGDGPIVVTETDDVFLRWTSVNATSCSTRQDTSTFSGALNSNLESLGSYNRTRVFTTTCTDGTNTASDSFTAVVGPSVRLRVNNLDNTTVTSGETVALSWSTRNADTCTVNPGSFTTPGNGGDTSAPLTADTTFTATCTGPGGTATDTATVTVTQPLIDPVLLSPFKSRKPIALAAPNGQAAIVFESVQNGTDNLDPTGLFISTYDGTTWTHPTSWNDKLNARPMSLRQAASHFGADMNANGDIIIAWHDAYLTTSSTATPSRVYWRMRRNGNWSSGGPIDPPNSCGRFRDVAISDNGDAIIVYQDRTVQGTSANPCAAVGTSQYTGYFSHYRNGSWRHVSNRLTQHFGVGGNSHNISMDDPSVDIDSNGNILLTWVQRYNAQANSTDVQMAAYKAEFRNSVWSYPTGLSDRLSIDGPAPSGTINVYPGESALADNGDAIVIWSQLSGTTGNYRRYSYKAEKRNGTWRRPANLNDYFFDAPVSLYTWHEVEMDANGRTVVVYPFMSTSSGTQLHRRTYNGSSWQPLPSVTSVNCPTQGISNFGAFSLAGLQGSDAAIMYLSGDIYFNQTSDFQNWTTDGSCAASRVNNPTGFRSVEPSVATDSNGRMVGAFIRYGWSSNRWGDPYGVLP